MQINVTLVVIVVAICAVFITGIITSNNDPPPIVEIDTDAEALKLMDECQRCREKEAKNWENALQKRLREIDPCEKASGAKE